MRECLFRDGGGDREDLEAGEIRKYRHGGLWTLHSEMYTCQEGMSWIVCIAGTGDIFAL